MASQTLILVVDDDIRVAEAHASLLKELGYETLIQTDPEKVEATLDSQPEVQIVLLDIRMPGMSGMELLQQIKLRHPHVGVIMATVVNDIEAAVHATKAGAYNYLLKPLQAERLAQVLDSYLTNRPGLLCDDPRFASFITRSPKFKEIFRRVKSFAEAEVTVLINGETGTGKELIARLVHNLSPRSKGPFIGLNVAALSPELFESELFGHCKGAFTSANYDRPGYFEQAAMGSLFLDEFGELRLEQQKKLLRVVQQRCFNRVGEARSRELSARLVIATNRNLAEDVQNEQFRSDLYYRLASHTILIPPLRERPEDIEPLCQFFFHKYCSQYGRTLEGFHPQSLTLLKQYSYPGNVRELEGIVSAAVLLEQEKLIAPDSLPDHLSFKKDITTSGTLEEARYNSVIEALARHDGNQTRAAAELGIARGTLNRWLKEFKQRQKAEVT